MADPFAVGLVALHGAAAGLAATYFPVDGPAVPGIRVTRTRPDRLGQFGDTAILPASNSFDILAADVAVPAIGAEILLGTGERFAISIEPLLDVEGVSWTCGAEPVA